ncbi:hypothetical protein [Burkholderia ubonensis]|uniref:hypothetical protein n=1 Tax=Burkholderia ubonensis TaxID=101571 RepID=UPI00075866B4|nr:hypothetical protein [Burkholderia ubonensis]KVW77433.1 hypothetical protein WK99_27960 [Burkholderia ubonensis]
MSNGLKWGIAFALSSAICLLLKSFAIVPSWIFGNGSEQVFGAVLLVALVDVAYELLTIERDPQQFPTTRV